MRAWNIRTLQLISEINGGPRGKVQINHDRKFSGGGGEGREKSEDGCEERVDVLEEVYQQVLGDCEHNFNDGGRSVLEENEP